jgi:hypothetical protein
MRKINLTISTIALFLLFIACKKSDNNISNAKTVQNLAGSYTITAINIYALGVNFDEFATLDACQKDNIVKLNADPNMTCDFIDAGVVCVPPEDSTGVWSLSANADSLTIQGTTAFIKSWDGKTLILAETGLISNQVATTTITLFKQ